MFLSIVIAIYNEGDNVVELTERIYDSMNSLKIPFELIYVIDGTDNSFDTLSRLSQTKTNIILDHSPKPRGFRNAFVKGFELVNEKATHILTMDGDLNHQPEEIKKLVDKINTTDASVVIGSRYIDQGKVEKIALWKKSVSIFANYIIKTVWGIKIHDKTSGFRLYDKKVIDKVMPLCKSDNFEFLFELLLLAKKKGCKIEEVPIVFKPRTKGESKFSFLKVGKGYLKLMFHYF